MVNGCSECQGRPRCRITLLWALSLNLVACGGSAGMAPTPISAMAAPEIHVQPSNQTVPMGLTATFSVTAGGTSLQYQWYRDGAALSGANSSSFTTAPTTFSDTGANFSVSVSNSGGSVTSSDASLTVTARAPAAGDFRFQQVDASYIVNGWGNAGGLSSAVPGRGAFTYSPSVGTPFFAGSGGDCAAPPVTDGTGCDWFYSQWYLTSDEGPAMGYGGDSYENFSADLQPGSASLLAGNGSITPNSPDAVINSLDLEPASDLFAVSWIQAPQSGGTGAQGQSVQPNGFVMVENTVPSSQLQAAATQEGAAGRVITAISVNGSEVTYLAYGWQADTTTLYDSTVLTASTPDAPTAAGTLASQGYIITAVGQADGTGDLFLVGTRVQGDTMPRPFQAVQGSSELHALQQQGYAVVGVVVNLSQPAAPYTWLGER